MDMKLDDNILIKGVFVLFLNVIQKLAKLFWRYNYYCTQHFL